MKEFNKKIQLFEDIEISINKTSKILDDIITPFLKCLYENKESIHNDCGLSKFIEDMVNSRLCLKGEITYRIEHIKSYEEK